MSLFERFKKENIDNLIWYFKNTSRIKNIDFDKYKINRDIDSNDNAAIIAFYHLNTKMIYYVDIKDYYYKIRYLKIKKLKQNVKHHV